MTVKGNAKQLTLEWISPDKLRPNARNPRTHSRKQIGQIATSIRQLGFLTPIAADDSNIVLAGHGRLEAAVSEGLKQVPVVRINHLTPLQKRAFVIADNKIAQQAGWDRELLAIELGELCDLLPAEGMEVSLTGFESAEIDLLFADLRDSPNCGLEDDIPALPEIATSRQGDLWCLGRHRLLCDDAREASSFTRVSGGQPVAAVFTDPPYNLRIKSIGGRGRIRHGEFAFASGEMNNRHFREFLVQTVHNGIKISSPGAVHYACMDWRHIDTLIDVGRELYDAMLNLVVWNKTNAGQGSFYRSQHELIGVFCVGNSGHRNNIELGRFGRNRSNVWTYPGINTFVKGRMDALAGHPTVKPVALVADALLDCTARHDRVLDQFAGSGTTLLAAEKVGRIGLGCKRRSENPSLKRPNMSAAPE